MIFQTAPSKTVCTAHKLELDVDRDVDRAAATTGQLNGIEASDSVASEESRKRFGIFSVNVDCLRL